MTPSRRAAVRPRVESASGGSVLLEDEIERLLADGVQGVVWLKGEPRSGRSTALQHLAELFPQSEQLLLMDRPFQASEGLVNGLVVCASDLPPKWTPRVKLTLSQWTPDECIEYLLNVHHDECASVMTRLKDAHGWQAGPELWTIVLDALAADPRLPDAGSALSRCIDAALDDPALRRTLEIECFGRLFDEAKPPQGKAMFESLNAPMSTTKPRPEWGAAGKLIRHRPVQVYLSARRLVCDLEAGLDFPLVEQIRKGANQARRPKGAPTTYATILAESIFYDWSSLLFPEEVRQTAVRLMSDQPRAVNRLREMADNDSLQQSLAVSLLYASGVDWRPTRKQDWNLRGASLAGAKWPEVDLRGAQLTNADLSRADLRGAALDDAFIINCNMTNTCMAGASLIEVHGNSAQFCGADLTSARIDRATFNKTNFAGANLSAVTAPGASFDEANLSRANLRNADLAGASLHQATLRETDFTGANLEGVWLSESEMQGGIFIGAKLVRVRLFGANLEGMNFDGANLEAANLTSAYLTGTSMVGAQLSSACLRKTGLADVNWERACLRDADLRGATFHTGTTRSGLLDSPIASEGSRTGFYTDEYGEQLFKSPEEIRCANLKYADLRGAHVEDVDFYLVDLRGALYDEDQERHFRRCGAILEDKCQQD